MQTKETSADACMSSVILRVGTFNIQNGAGVGHDFCVIANDILSAGLDVAGLQEIDLDTGRNRHQNTMKRLSEATGYTYYEYAANIDFDGGKYGTGILSRYPIVSYETVMMASGGGEQRSYGHAVIDVKGMRFDFYNTHLSWSEKAARAEQMVIIGREVSTKKRFVLTGDFNTDNAFEYIRYMPEGTTFANDSFCSCPGYGRFDNVVAGPAVKILSAQMADREEHSDHYMVYADLLFEK